MIRILRIGLLALGGSTAAIVSTGCKADCEDILACGYQEHADGGSCDRTRHPSEETCLLSDEHSIFVAPSGADVAAGTRDAPVKSISKAVELAQRANKVIVVCNATYNESVKLTAAVKLYGGFSCPGDVSPWSYQPGTRAEVHPLTPAPRSTSATSPMSRRSPISDLPPNQLAHQASPASPPSLLTLRF